MHYTIESLLNGKEVGNWYQWARAHWGKFLATNPTAEEIAEWCDQEQHNFERNCGGRWIGQEVMVISGIAYYYTTRSCFDDNPDKAQAVYKGLVSNWCSVEVKIQARRVAKYYDLDVSEDYPIAGP